jgi:hypothetical protein
LHPKSAGNDFDKQYMYSDNEYEKGPWLHMYHTGCDDFKNFVRDNNKKENGKKYFIHDEYVNFVRTHINYDNKTIVYNLERAKKNETRV